MAVYGDYDQQELDNQYNQNYWVSDIETHSARSREMNQWVQENLEAKRDIAYGDREEERLDIFLTDRTPAPVRIFFHGGAWLRNTKENAAYAAKMHVEAGAHFIAVNFAKADQAPLDEMIRQSRSAVAWVYRNIADFGGDPERILIAGISSGAHQGGLVLCADWSEFGLPAEVIKGAALTSGMYDLKPVRLSARNDYLHLDEAAALRNSAIHHIPARGCPLIIAHAEHDSDEFRRQSRTFAAAWVEHGHPLRYIPMAGFNHFSIGGELGDPDSALGGALLDQLRDLL